MNQLQLAIDVINYDLNEKDALAGYSGDYSMGLTRAKKDILAVAAIDMLAAICRAAAPSAPDTAAEPERDRAKHMLPAQQFLMNNAVADEKPQWPAEPFTAQQYSDFVSAVYR